MIAIQPHQKFCVADKATSCPVRQIPPGSAGVRAGGLGAMLPTALRTRAVAAASAAAKLFMMFAMSFRALDCKSCLPATISSSLRPSNAEAPARTRRLAVKASCQARMCINDATLAFSGGKHPTPEDT